MNQNLPPCRTIEVVTFRGDRSKSFAASIKSALDDERNGCGPGPTRLDCVLFIGHAGVSIDGGNTYFGFGPDDGSIPAWQLMRELDLGRAFPGRARDDSAIFAVARNRGLKLLSMRIVLPEPEFRKFETSLDGELRKSQYSYGFPDGDGDCNCVTWLERLGLPLLTGALVEFVGLVGWTSNPRRQFGACT